MKTRNTRSTTEIFPLWPSFFRQREVLHWSRVVYAFFCPAKRSKENRKNKKGKKKQGFEGQGQISLNRYSPSASPPTRDGARTKPELESGPDSPRTECRNRWNCSGKVRNRSLESEPCLSVGVALIFSDEEPYKPKTGASGICPRPNRNRTVTTLRVWLGSYGVKIRKTGPGESLPKNKGISTGPIKFWTVREAVKNSHV